MKKRTLIGIILATFLLTAVLSGCSAEKKTSDTQNTESATQAEVSNEEPDSEESDSEEPQAREAEEAVETGETEKNEEEAADTAAVGPLVIYFDYSENIDTTGVDADAITSATLRGDATANNTGKLLMLVDEIRALEGADVFSIQVNETYAPGYDDMVDQARQDIADGKSFTFKNELAGLDSYETVYIVTPVWWSELPQPVQVFFEQYDFSGKTIIPVVIHRGSGFGRTVIEMEEFEPDAVFADGIAIEADIDNSEAKAELDTFLASRK